MHVYSETDLATLRALCEAKGVPGELIHHEFVPDGAEDESDHVTVLSRRFTPAELATWVDAPDNLTTARNTGVILILSIDGSMPSPPPEPPSPPLAGKGSVIWLGDLMDGTLRAIARAAARPLGIFDPDELAILKIGRKTTADEVATSGLPSSVLALRGPYPDPGQLRGIKTPGVPAFVVRRPTLDEYATMAKVGVKQSSLVDLLLECIVEPAPIAERRGLVERFPGLGLTCLPIFQAMRSAGATIEKKGSLSDGAR
jgi:hypothetical protein